MRFTHILPIGIAAALAMAAGRLPTLRPDPAESLTFLGFISPAPATASGRDRLAAAEGAVFALDPAARRLFVACRATASLTVLDLDSGRTVALLPVGEGPISLAFDAPLHRLYVLGREGVLSVVAQTDPDSYRLLDSIRLHRTAETLALDPETHRLSVAFGGRMAHGAAFAPKRPERNP